MNDYLFGLEKGVAAMDFNDPGWKVKTRKLLQGVRI